MKISLSESLTNQKNKLFKDPNSVYNFLSGKPRVISPEPVSTFYHLFGTGAQLVSILAKKNILPGKLISYLLETGWEQIYLSYYHKIEEDFPKPSEAVFAHPDGYVISFQILYHGKNRQGLDIENMDTSDVLDAIEILNDKRSVSYVNEINFLYKNENGPIDECDVYTHLHDYIKQIVIDEPIENKIGIVSVSHNDFYVKEFSLEEKTPAFSHPDLHYGTGFLEFHNNLLQRLDKNNKGLVLFHGEPGTGKTQYIRVLLNELSKLKKSVLYAPPGMSASLTDPDMIEFISEWIFEEERDCILLIEDAEPLLENRNNSDGRSVGISNLLNMTDGLLNDILGLTVIATFNTKISNIDPALLRQQRLIARKEFKKINGEQAEELAKAIGIETPDIMYPATLAEFYASRNENETLTHDIEMINKNIIGFKN